MGDLLKSHYLGGSDIGTPSDGRAHEKAGSKMRSPGKKTLQAYRDSTENPSDREYMTETSELGEYERPYSAMAFSQVSKHHSGNLNEGILTSGDLGENGSFTDKSCQDSLMINPDLAIFGVFDGVGGSANGRLASEMASDYIYWLSNPERKTLSTEKQERNDFSTGEQLAAALDDASRYVSENVKGGTTTASLARIVNRGDKKYLCFAQVGDSRIYIVDKNGKAKMVTRDEGYGHWITNSLGGKTARDKTCKQYGDIPLEPGSRIVICTDGITGDYEPDLMSDETIGRIVSEAQSPQEACIKLVKDASKIDDRTVIVVFT